MSTLLTIGVLILIFVSTIVVLLVLMQRAKNDGGVGAAMGGGMAEATFGAETTNVLSKATIRGSIIFFVLGFLLYLGYIYNHHQSLSSGAAPEISVPAAIPATPAAPAATPAPAPATPAQ